MEHKIHNTPNGFALYIALIVMSVLTLVAFSISRIALKEVSLSRWGKDSQIAFYAADTGVECALYNDINLWEQEIFPVDGSGSADVICGGSIITPTYSTDGATTTTSFKAEDIGYNKACVLVDVSKYDPDDDGISDRTTIEAKGRTNCDSNVRRIERGVRVTY